MNSTLLDNVHGFLNRRSVVQDVDWWLNVGVVPISVSSHPSMGVNSTATVGLRDFPESVILQLGAAPTSTIAIGSGEASD